MTTISVQTAMRELGVDKESFRVVGLLPLVYVAWADGSMQRAERALIRRAAKQKGWLAGGGEALLERWLAEPPPEKEVRTGLALLRQLASDKRGVGVAVSVDTLESLLVLCRDVAEAAGGRLGLADPITAGEDEALREIAAVFELEGAGDTWHEIVALAEGKLDAEVPTPRGHILIGNMLEMLRDPLGTLMRVHRDHGDVVRLRFPGETAYLLARPEHIKYVLADNRRNYVRGLEYERLRGLVGASAFTTDGEEWRKHRHIGQPAFRPAAIDALAPMIARVGGEMVGGWPIGGPPIDAADEMMRATLRVIGLAALGTDLVGEAGKIGEAVTVAIRHASDAMMNPLHIPELVPTPENVRFKRAMRTIDELLVPMIHERRRAEDAARDLLSMVIHARDDETGEGLDDDGVRSELITYLIAGHETTACALAWTLYLLSTHPDVARRARAEVIDRIGDREPTAEDAAALDYVGRVIDESMRIYPPIWAISREAVAEDVIGGFRIPSGSLVFTSQWVTHRLDEVWPNPEGFDPDRFTPERSEGRHPFAFFPFGAGPHKCIGYPLAQLEARILLAVILQRVRLDLVPGVEPEPLPGVTLRVKDGLPMTVHTP